MTDGPIRPNAPGGANNPLHIVYTGTADTFAAVNAALAVADAAVDLNGQALTGAASVDGDAGALALGADGTKTTSLSIGQATVAPVLTGGATIASGKALTGAGAMAVEATGALTLAGAAGTTSSLIGRAGNLTTMVGDTRFAGKVEINLADAGAAAASGTASAHAGTFTVASGQTGYVLTNSKITTTSLLFCTCISGAVGQTVLSFIPTANTGTLLLSGAAGADSKFAFLVITPGA